MVERGAEAAVVVIFDGHEPEGLQHAVGEFPHGAEHFGHAVDRAGLRLKGDFDEVPLPERMLQAEQTSGDGDGLEFGFGPAAVFETNGSENGVSQLYSSRAPGWVRLGEVRHR
jgi:hypothetical protein